MADKYHINSKGMPGVCKANGRGCPFGAKDQHYATESQAFEALGSELGAELLVGHSKKKDPRAAMGALLEEIASDVASFSSVQSPHSIPLNPAESF